MTDSIRRWVRPDVLELSAYAVPDAQGLIKLDAMENPYGWPDAMRDAWLERLGPASLNRYPDADAAELKDALRSFNGLPFDTPIVTGNGSDELIMMLMQLVGGSGRTVLSFDPSFVMYRMIATFTGSRYVGVPLTDDWQIDLDATLAAIREHDPALIFIASPNNPTGNAFSSDDIGAICDAMPGLVVLDEAYAAFSTDAPGPALLERDNLILMRTLSKLGLAGLRVGMVAGSAGWLAQLEKVRLPYNLNVLSQATAAFALRYRNAEGASVLEEQIAAIIASRTGMMNALSEISGVEVYPSDANFILLRTPRCDATTVHARLLDRNVLVKCLDGGHPRLAGCLRVTVGKHEENTRFIEAFVTAVAEAGDQ